MVFKKKKAAIHPTFIPRTHPSSNRSQLLSWHLLTGALLYQILPIIANHKIVEWISVHYQHGLSSRHRHCDDKEEGGPRPSCLGRTAGQEGEERATANR